MAQPYIGELRIFAGNFAPAGWMSCEGQLLPISENATLFEALGTTYGGDGQTTFALPDFRGRVPMHMGNFTAGTQGGAEIVTLSVQQIPMHTHALLATGNAATSTSPTNNVLGVPSFQIYATGSPTGNMNPALLAPAGGSQPHENRQPYLALMIIISLFGIFPSATAVAPSAAATAPQEAAS